MDFIYKKYLFILVVIFLLLSNVSCSSNQPSAQITPPEGWHLVWNDEFEGDSIDLKNWGFDLGAGGWGNGEAEYYTSRSENARLEEGMLVIEARQEKYEDSYFTSARLKTQGLQEFQFGRIEARIKVPAGKGLWPAFWMLGNDFSRTTGIGIPWPFCGEIDIMEYIGREPDLIMGTVHGPGYAGAVGLGKWNRQTYNIADEFHTYAIEWEAGQIKWFYDDVEYFSVVKSDIGDREWVFDKPFFIILNLAVGGQLPGPVGLDVKFPVQMYVDYVRVFQKNP